MFAALAAAALLLPATRQVRTVAGIVRTRFGCPLDLEFLESAHVYHAWRLSRGLGLYNDPAAGFATFPYPPLYWVAIQAAAKVFGFTDQAGRAVSILSLLGFVAIMGWLVARAAPTKLLGVAFAGMAIAGICTGYPCCGGAYDLVRSDMMGMFLTVAAAAAARDGLMPPARAWLTALLLAASIYTKQTGLMFAGWIVLFAFLRDARGGMRLAWRTALLCTAPLLVLEVMTRGWFGVWILYPGKQGIQADRWIEALMGFVQHAPFVLVLPWLVPELRRRRWLRPTTALWTGMYVAGFASGLLTWLKNLCWVNVWMPELLLAWPVALMLVGDACRGLWPRGAPGRVAAWGVLGLSSALLASFHYDVGALVPGPDRWEAAERLDEIVRGLDGGVVVTTAPMVAISAGSTVEQPILPTYEDAISAGMPLDYVDALAASGAKWVITTDRYAGTDRAPEPRMTRAFSREQTFDFNVRGMSSWDHPTEVVLWRRIGR